MAHAAEPKRLSAEEKARLETRIKAVLKEKDAVLVAHYYARPDIQRLAEESGGCVADSENGPLRERLNTQADAAISAPTERLRLLSAFARTAPAIRN
ncbi:MAG: quinolinate synthase NadA, partial [Marinobacter sp.]|nr:quinolinate synthase NadA [Marinobacter sp.]